MRLVALAALIALTSCTGFAPPSNGGVSPAARSHAASGDLLYVSDLGANAVLYYTYPQGSLVGKLTGFADVSTLCSNKAGDVFVVDGASDVQVFAHAGTSPIRKLPWPGGLPNGCSVDPVTGNLALTNESSYSYGTVTIYPKARGKPKPYYNKMVDATFFCGYDDKGNLFMDGWNRSGVPIFLELPKGGKTISVVTLGHQAIKTPGGVEWDGKYIAVGDNGAGQIYRLTPGGKIVQTITLHSGTQINQFWLQGTTLIGPDAQSNGAVPFWHYPGGGSPFKTIKGFSYPIGATVSAGSTRE